MHNDYDNSLQSYFTNMEHLRAMFRNFVFAEKLPKRLIVFHGIGGVGKSSLLRMYRLQCKSEKIPVALTSGDDAKSTLDVITRWMEDLKEDGVKFSSLNKTLESYRAIQAKVEDQAKKSQNRVADIAGKAASKTAEAAGGALLGAAIGSVVPGVGTAIGGMLGSAVGGMGMEALTDWLRGFLDKSAIELLLDPAKKLTSDFLEDIAKAAEKKRIVLLLDTYEQISALEDWIGETAQKIHPNVLMVIAGRKLPDWNRVWSGWMMNAQVEELKPMTEDIMRQLIHRYYATMRGGVPDNVQVDVIIKFARGLPMVVTSAVQLWVKYGVEDFQSVKTEIVANLVDRLMEGVPSSLIPALEAAAVVRWFDQPILRAVLNKEDVRDVYNELRRFPFVRTRNEGLALHDSVREMMDENLRMQDSERYAEFHERAAVYFERRLEKVTGVEAERLGLEGLYHRICVNENTGIKLFQEFAEDLLRFWPVSRLRTLVNDVNTYPLNYKTSRSWGQYYAGMLAKSDGYVDLAEKIFTEIGFNVNLEKKLRAYALCGLGSIMSIWENMAEPNRVKETIDVLKKSLELQKTDAILVESLHGLAHTYRYQGKWDEALIFENQAIHFYKQHQDEYGLLDALGRLKMHYAGTGNWKDMFANHEIGANLALALEKDSHAKATFLDAGEWALAWAGRYSQAEQHLKESLRISKELEDVFFSLRCHEHLGLLLAVQDRFQDALEHFKEAEEIAKQPGKSYEQNYMDVESFLGVMLVRQGKFDDAKQKLESVLSFRERLKINLNIPEVLFWLGQVYEINAEVMSASNMYLRCIEFRWTGRKNFESASLTGLTRVKHAQGDIAAIPSLLAEAEQLAQQYEYNDHLASLRLTQGHLAWENGNQDEAIAFYQKAMIYALRYNRFLLDELLSGRPQGTPLHPIISHCLEHGEDGNKFLIALREWWKTGVNDIGTPRPDTISPIPEGISLLEAEKIARERELGDGSAQKSVIEQIEAVL